MADNDQTQTNDPNAQPPADPPTPPAPDDKSKAAATRSRASANKTTAAPPANESEGQRINRQLAEAAAEAEERQADEMDAHEMTVDKRPPASPEGVPMHGRFIVDGVMVDPMGRPFDQQPK